jgi:hypothetical protein
MISDRAEAEAQRSSDLVGHGIVMKWCHLFVRHQGKIAVKFEFLSIKKLKMLIKCIICGNSEKPLFQFLSDSGVRAEWFEVLREICGTRKEIR